MIGVIFERVIVVYECYNFSIKTFSIHVFVNGNNKLEFESK